MSPKSFETLKAALTLVDEAHWAGTSGEEVIAQLTELHGAKRTLAASGNTLRCATVTATCTWSKGNGLVLAWQRLARLACQQEARK